MVSLFMREDMCMWSWMWMHGEKEAEKDRPPAATKCHHLYDTHVKPLYWNMPENEQDAQLTHTLYIRAFASRAQDSYASAEQAAAASYKHTF